MQVDFYQLAETSPEQVIASLAEKVLASGGRLLIVAAGEARLARLDRMLWDQGAINFLPHGPAGGADDARQPILLPTTPDAPNLARNMLGFVGFSPVRDMIVGSLGTRSRESIMGWGRPVVNSSAPISTKVCFMLREESGRAWFPGSGVLE